MNAPTAPTSPSLRLIVAGLSLTQIIGWGTTYFLPGVMSATLMQATGLSRTGVYAGVTVMVLTSALASPMVGRWIERHGARWALMAGASLLAIGLLILAVAAGPVLYYAAWVCFGLGMPLGLSFASSAALVQIDAGRARQAIGAMLLLTILSQTVFWPLTAWLEPQIGWQMLCLLYAGLNLGISLPLHALLLPRSREMAVKPGAADVQGSVPPHRRKLAAVLLTLAFALCGFVTWGLDLHLITLMVAMGLAPSAAVAAGALRGPLSLTGRLADFVLVGRVSSTVLTAAATGMVFFSFVAVWVAGDHLLGAYAFLALFAMGAGIMTVARSTLPLALFGSQTYASITGAIALPTQIVFASAPPIYALVIDHLGVLAMVALSAAASGAAFLALLAICWLS